MITTVVTTDDDNISAFLEPVRPASSLSQSILSNPPINKSTDFNEISIAPTIPRNNDSIFSSSLPITDITYLVTSSQPESDSVIQPVIHSNGSTSDSLSIQPAEGEGLNPTNSASSNSPSPSASPSPTPSPTLSPSLFPSPSPSLSPSPSSPVAIPAPSGIISLSSTQPAISNPSNVPQQAIVGPQTVKQCALCHKYRLVPLLLPPKQQQQQEKQQEENQISTQQQSEESKKETREVITSRADNSSSSVPDVSKDVHTAHIISTPPLSDNNPFSASFLPSLMSDKFTCAEHPILSQRSCSYPQQYRDARLIDNPYIRLTPPYNFSLLGLLPFDDSVYNSLFQCEGWSKHQTLYLMERIKDVGMDFIESVTNDKILGRWHNRKECEARLLQIFTLASIFQLTISTLAKPFNPYYAPSISLLKKTKTAANLYSSHTPSSHHHNQKKHKYKSYNNVSSSPVHATAEGDEVRLGSLRSSSRLATQQRKRYTEGEDTDADEEEEGEGGTGGGGGEEAGGERVDRTLRQWTSSSDEDEEPTPEELAERERRKQDRRAAKLKAKLRRQSSNKESEYQLKVEKILGDRRKRVRADENGMPIINLEKKEERKSQEKGKEEEKADIIKDEKSTEQNGLTNSSSNPISSPIKPERSQSEDTSMTDGDTSKPPLVHNTSTGSQISQSSNPHLLSPRKRSSHLHRHESDELPLDEDIPDTVVITEYLVKVENVAYLHVEWHTRDSMEVKFGERNTSERISRYYKGKKLLDAQNLDRFGGEYFDPKYTQVDRIIASKDITVKESPTPQISNIINTNGAPIAPPLSQTKTIEMYLVKWQGLSYSMSTWETADNIGDSLAIAQFKRFNRPLTLPTAPAYTRDFFDSHKLSWYNVNQQWPYKNGHRLRDYQVQGLNWLINSWYDKRNCILADEMGLGKTVQCVTLFEHLRSVERNQGPFMVVVPLGTLSHWKREVESWTNMNCIIYHDPWRGKETRDMIRKHEFYYSDSHQVKFQILITTYEVLVADVHELAKIDWKCMVVDEGHRLKNKSSKILESLRVIKCDRRLLLTGTPIQNNTTELWTLMNFLEPATFSSQSVFQKEYGHLTESQQVSSLQQRIRPYVLRRMKEAVEKSIPPKEETIIDIELTTIQKKYYRAIYEKNIAFLRQGVSKSNMPRLVNIEMELRKCCNHPWLISGAEDKELPLNHTEYEYMTKTIAASGKMVLLDKLLPKLKADGHRVLIFSQMIQLLDIIQEYADFYGYNYERLDGNVRGNEREAAIDRFVRPESNRFLFLLSTRAGGVGLNLASADTVIIFDSDWNPQQDMQAQARAHRIGQKNKVMIYRLVTRNTYESEMFARASKKLGLDHAVLTNLEEGQGDIDIADKASIDKILKLGAYGLFDEEGDNKAKEFEQASIDDILAKNAHVVTFAKPPTATNGEDEGEADSSTGTGGDGEVDGTVKSEGDTAEASAQNKFRLNYSKMRFSSESGSAQELDIRDPDFWLKMLGHNNFGVADQLSAQLEDRNALLTPAAKEKFWSQLENLADSILTAKRKGEEPADIGMFIQILFQVSQSNHIFTEEQRWQAKVWDTEADDKTRKVRVRKEEEQKKSKRGRRSGRGGKSDFSTSKRGGRTRHHVDEESDDLSSDDDNDDDDENGINDSDDAYAGKKYKAGGRTRGRNGTVMNHDICSICHCSGALVACEGGCCRYYHLECLDMTKKDLPDPDENWFCPDCVDGVHECHHCGKRGPENDSAEGVHRCSIPFCGFYYHQSCIRLYSQTTIFLQNDNFKCTSHYCMSCKQSPEAFLARCITCPNAIHVKCMGNKEVRLSKRNIYCEDCVDSEAQTERGKRAIEESKIHTQVDYVRKKIKILKKNKKKKDKKEKRKRKEDMTPQELDSYLKELADKRREARLKVKLKKQQQRLSRGEQEETESDNNSDSNATATDDSSNSISNSSSNGSDLSSPMSDENSLSITDDEVDYEESPLSYHVKFFLDQLPIFEADNIFVSKSSGKKSEKKKQHEKEKKRKAKKKAKKEKITKNGRRKLDKKKKMKMTKSRVKRRNHQEMEEQDQDHQTDDEEELDYDNEEEDIEDEERERDEVDNEEEEDVQEAEEERGDGRKRRRSTLREDKKGLIPPKDKKKLLRHSRYENEVGESDEDVDEFDESVPVTPILLKLSKKRGADQLSRFSTLKENKKEFSSKQDDDQDEVMENEYNHQKIQLTRNGSYPNMNNRNNSSPTVPNLLVLKRSRDSSTSSPSNSSIENISYSADSFTSPTPNNRRENKRKSAIINQTIKLKINLKKYSAIISNSLAQTIRSSIKERMDNQIFRQESETNESIMKDD